MLKFSEKQEEYFKNANHRWNIKIGATRSGKTYSDYYVIPYRIRNCSDNGLKVIMGNSQNTIERNILRPMRNLWGSTMVGHIIKGENKVRLFGSDCYVVGAGKSNQVEAIQGSGMEYCYGDEMTTWNQEVFEMLKSRLSEDNSKFDGTGNPASPHHWLKEFLDSDADIYLQNYILDDNPFLTDEFIRNLKKEYSGVYYDRYILGEWVMAEGAVYDVFNRKKHIVPTVDRDYKEYYVSIDYGTNNPMAMGLWGKCNNTWYKIKEYHYDGRKMRRQKTDSEYADDYEYFIDDRDIKEVIVDPSASSYIAELENRGHRVRKANNDVLEGIRNVQQALVKGKILYNDCCLNTFKEFDTYVWDTKAGERGEDKPIKRNDHHMDSDRYFVRTILCSTSGLNRIGGVRSWYEY